VSSQRPWSRCCNSICLPALTSWRQTCTPCAPRAPSLTTTLITELLTNPLAQSGSTEDPGDQSTRSGPVHHTGQLSMAWNGSDPRAPRVLPVSNTQPLNAPSAPRWTLAIDRLGCRGSLRNEKVSESAHHFRHERLQTIPFHAGGAFPTRRVRRSSPLTRTTYLPSYCSRPSRSPRRIGSTRSANAVRWVCRTWSPRSNRPGNCGMITTPEKREQIKSVVVHGGRGVTVRRRLGGCR
jgi:hypothetical protein